MENKFKDTYKISTNRLSTWDYSSSGWYFVSVCVKDRKCVFGKIVDRKMVLSKSGEIVKKCWDEIPNHFENIKIDEFIVMPNHIHGIIIINDDNNIRRDVINHVSTNIGNLTPMGTGHLGEIVRWVKGKSSYMLHKINPTFSWQTRYFDHIIRNETSLQKIREYIRFNPLKWDVDLENPIIVKTPLETSLSHKNPDRTRE